MNNFNITDKEKSILANLINKKQDVKPVFITAGAIYGEKIQKLAWTSSLSKLSKKTQENTDSLPLTEERLREVKKHDIIDVGHRNSDLVETIEAKLSDGNNSRTDEDVLEISEGLLEEVRANEAIEVLTEGELEAKWNEATWSGDDIKIYRDVNARQKMDAEANEAFYARNPELTSGGRGTVSASRDGTCSICGCKKNVKYRFNPKDKKFNGSKKSLICDACFQKANSEV